MHSPGRQPWDPHTHPRKASSPEGATGVLGSPPACRPFGAGTTWVCISGWRPRGGAGLCTAAPIGAEDSRIVQVRALAYRVLPVDAIFSDRGSACADPPVSLAGFRTLKLGLGRRLAYNRVGHGRGWIGSIVKERPDMSREERKDPTAEEATSAVEEVEVRGHIVDSLLLPKILDRILQMGGTFEIRECRIGSRRVDPSFARIAIRAADRGRARRDPGRPDRAWRLAREPRGREGRGGRHRGGLPRGLLQHDQPADPGPARRPLGRRGRPGDGLRDRRRCRGQVRAVRGDDRRDARHADRRRPRGGPGRAGRTAPRVDPVRVHGVERLEREAQGGQPPGGRGHDPGHARRGEEGPARRRPGDRPHRARRGTWPG